MNHFSKLKSRVSKENMLPIPYKSTTDSQELVQLPREVNGIPSVGFSGKLIKLQMLILTAFSFEVYIPGFHSSVGCSMAQHVLLLQ